MTPPIKFLLCLATLAGLLAIAGSVPWTSKTVVDITVVDEEGHPIPGAKVGLISGPGGILAEGTTNDAGTLVLKYSPKSDTGWGKHVWRFDIFIAGYSANETPVSMSETKEGTIRAWFPNADPRLEKPHLLFRIKSRIVCRKIS